MTGEYENGFNSVADAAITLDKQSILVSFELFWRYDESKLYNVATRYKTRESLYQPISTSLKGIIKDCVGKKSINEISEILGYPSPSQFIRQFTKTMGISHHRYRKLNFADNEKLKK